MSTKHQRQWAKIKEGRAIRQQRIDRAVRNGERRYVDTPLRTAMSYLGSKRKAIPHLLPFFPSTDEIVAPFMGGGSIEMELLRLGKTVYTADLFEPQANYWLRLKKDGRLVRRYAAELVEEYGQDRIITTKHHSEIVRIAEDRLGNGYRRAAAQWVRAKISVQSDAHFGGGRNPANPEKVTPFNTRAVTDRALDKLLVSHYHLKAAGDRFKFNHADWRSTLDRHPNVFAYLDLRIPTMPPTYSEMIAPTIPR